MNRSPLLRRRPNLAGLAFLLISAFTAPSLLADCTVSASGVVFGSYDVFNPASLDGVGNVNVNCDPVIGFTVKLSAGGGSYSQREMSGTGGVLDYNLYTNASRSIVWGDGAGGTGVGGGTGGNVNLSVYGRIPAGQNLPAGSYGDTIVVTVEF
jgi:spore coat protein U-like protein